ncbi:hypothetical protein EG68_03412 [Paragonimus skrjabini miyazakii]|uniref:Rho GTPase-activating protein FF domain-containing protein n=1 Tax=Paragonimus skrjabini miyazakii TaxID=59628 RepID=A0A8S9YXK8_9TREM|nr:hypothetical protein EG68_03412 [Paragonimus skrjabini miyazakii]
MPNSSQVPHVSATKTYNISVVGPPNAGKSCICNRFALPHPDFYRQEHLSVLSAADYESEVVNCDNWLYWGCVSRQVDDFTVNFRIIEQTEFLNDSTFQPFVSGRRFSDAPLDYVQRSSVVRLSSKHKLRYICKEQLGQENIYEKEYFPSGDIEVNGFILVYDNNTHSRKLPNARNVVQRQIKLYEFLALLVKLKKPIVLAISKCEASPQEPCEDLSLILQKYSEFRRIPLIETSAHQNVNIEQTFLTLVKLIDKPRMVKLRPLRYSDAIHIRKSEVEYASNAFKKLLSHAPPEFLESWESFMKRYSQQGDVVTFISLVGTDVARREFNQYIAHHENVTRRNNFDRVTKVLAYFLPNLDPIRDKPLDEVVQYIRKQEQFALYFRDTCSDSTSDQLADTCECRTRRQTKREDNRIPFDFLIQPQDQLQDSPLQLYINELVLSEQRHFEQARFETALFTRFLLDSADSTTPKKSFVDGTTHILPGQPISDLQHILRMVQLPDLTDEQIALVYKHFQNELHVRAREDFLDLLMERTDLFVQTVQTYINQLRESTSAGGQLRTSPSDSSVKSSLDDSPDSVCTVSAPKSAASVSDNRACSEHLSHVFMLAAPPRVPRRYSFVQSSNSDLGSWASLTDSRAVHPTNLPVSDPLHQDLCSQFCPALSWGGCVDKLLKQLAYRHLTISPRCLEPGLGHSTKLGYRSTSINLRSVYPFTDLSYRPNKSVHLCIAVACVCTDLLAAEAVTHLLACAGFSISSSLSPRHEASKVVSFDEGSSGASSHPDSTYPPMQPLIVSASWPLSTDRLPAVRFTHCSDATDGSDAAELIMANQPIPDGQVHASLMSVHRLLNHLITAPDCVGPHCSNSRLASTCAAPSNLNQSACPYYHGYIFIVTVPPDQKPSITSSASMTNTTVTALDGNCCIAESNKPLSHLSSFDVDNEGDDNVQTPRPSSVPLFFTHSLDDDSPLSTDCKTADRERDRSLYIDPPCTCCSLFEVGADCNVDACSCGSCCDCMVIGTSIGSHAHRDTEVDDRASRLHRCQNDPAPSSVAYRPRSWHARISAVRSALSLLPKDAPHLILLTEQAAAEHACGKPMTTTKPMIYPAPRLLYQTHCASANSVDCSSGGAEVKPPIGDSCESDSSTADSFKPSGRSSIDWMPVGTNILDHVINFLNDCWRESITSAGSDSLQTGSVPTSGQFVHICKPQTLLQTLEEPNMSKPCRPIFADKVINSKAQCMEKPTSNNPFLFAASATGRRAMQTANQALKKLSANARRHQNCSSSTVTTSSAVSSIPSSSGKSNSIVTGPVVPSDIHSSLSSSSSSQTITAHSTKSFSLISNPSGNNSSNPATVIAKNLGSAVLAAVRTSAVSQPKLHSSTDQNGVIGWTRGAYKMNSISDKSSVRNTSVESAKPVPLFDLPTSAAFCKSRLRASVDRTYAIRRGLLPGSRSMRSRCSVPDCALLSQADSYSSLSVSNRTLSSNTLVPCAPVQSKDSDSPHVIPISGSDSGDSSVDSNRPYLASPSSGDSSLVLNSVGEQSASSQREAPDEDISFSSQSPDIFTNAVLESQALTNPAFTSPTDFASEPSNLDRLHDRPDRVLAFQSSSPLADLNQSTGYDVESIYEDLYLPWPNWGSDVEEGAGQECTPVSTHANFSNLLAQRSVSTSSEEHIYLDPIDCIGPACLERHRCAMTVQRRLVDNRLDAKQFNHDCIGKNTVMGKTDSLVAGAVVRRRRERHRSFSTPEGCTSAISVTGPSKLGSDTLQTYGCAPSLSSLVRETTNQQFLGSINSRHHYELFKPTTFISSGSDSSGVPTTKSCCSLAVCSSSSSQRLFSAPTQSSCGTSISSPPSGMFSAGTCSDRGDRTNENPLTDVSSADLFLPRPLSRVHHHHLWHHIHCAHYYRHRTPLEKVSLDSGCCVTLTPVFSCKSESLHPPAPPIHTSPRCNSSATVCDSTVHPQIFGKPGGIAFPGFKNRPLLFTSAIKAGVPISNFDSTDRCRQQVDSVRPVFIDPSDFPTHPPTAHAVNFPSVVKASQCSPSCSNTPVTSSQHSQKDSKWTKRGRKASTTTGTPLPGMPRLNFFQTNRSNSSTTCTCCQSNYLVSTSAVPAPSRQSSTSVCLLQSHAAPYMSTIPAVDSSSTRICPAGSQATCFNRMSTIPAVTTANFAPGGYTSSPASVSHSRRLVTAMTTLTFGSTSYSPPTPVPLLPMRLSSTEATLGVNLDEQKDHLSGIFFRRWAILKQSSSLVELFVYLLFCCLYNIFISASKLRITTSTHTHKQRLSVTLILLPQLFPSRHLIFSLSF